MPLVQWSDRYATGVAQIDEQHGMLFKAVNDLHDGLMAGKGRDVLVKTVAFLVDYTVQHFREEEAYMERHGFPGLSAHRQEHRMLLDEVAVFQEQFRKDAASVRPMEVARFLGDWLTHHIHQMDMQYAAFTRSLPAR